MRRFPAPMALLALVAVVPAASLGARAEESPTSTFVASANSLVSPGKAPPLTLLYTGNVVGYIEPCG